MATTKTVEFVNEKGNTLVSVRNEMKKQSMAMLESALKNEVENFVVVTKRGTIAVQIGTSEHDGRPIYFEVEGRVNQTDPDYLPSKKSKTKSKNTETETVKLFE